jgi:four helix bundle protein
MIVKAHHKLKAWQVAMTLVKDVYECTRTYPDTEKFGLVTQSQRAAVSIPANISEGAARKSEREFRRFLLIARGSLAELETHLRVAEMLGYLEIGQLNKLLKQVERLYGLLNGLIRKHEMSVAEELEPYGDRLGSSPVFRLPSTP